MRDVTKKEVEGVLAAPEEKKYKYFIGAVVGREEILALHGKEGWHFEKLENGLQALSVWPTEEFLPADNSKREYIPKTINLYDFIERWIPHMLADGLAVMLYGDVDLWLKENISLLKRDLLEEICGIEV
jgi:hypothetical protein